MPKNLSKGSSCTTGKHIYNLSGITVPFNLIPMPILAILGLILNSCWPINYWYC